MKVLETSQLSAEQLKQLFELWNAEYPKEFIFESEPAFHKYLDNLEELEHLLLLSSNTIKAWYFSFNRAQHRWFGLMLDKSIQNKGVGTRVLNYAKNKDSKLHAWVLIEDKLIKQNGEPYNSPIQFYEKNGFKKCKALRMNGLKTIEMQWP